MYALFRVVIENYYSIRNNGGAFVNRVSEDKKIEENVFCYACEFNYRNAVSTY